jgi:hypothetical protein
MATLIQDKTPEERKAIAAKSVATRLANIAKRKAEDAAYEQQAKELKYGIKKLEEEFNRLTKEVQREVKFGEAVRRLTSDVLLREHEIVEHAVPLHTACGIYFLIFESIQEIGRESRLESGICKVISSYFLRSNYGLRN